MLTMMRAGPISSVQDAGRRGHRASGVSVGGAMDDLALALANLLAGNPPDAAVIEFTLYPVRIRFEQAAVIALAGAELEAHLDQAAVWAGWRIAVRSGQTLHIEGARAGMRGYLAVRGGIDVPIVLGSRSTDLKAGFGGWRGRLLKDGDCLPVSACDAPALTVQRIGIRLPHPVAPVRVLPGPEFHEFPAAAQSALWSADWTLTARSDRMGFRLSGPPLQRLTGDSLPSHGVLPGLIQVPPSGQPIVLMADAQTTGGYPRIGVVIQADRWKLAQCRPAATLRFALCTPQQALAAWAARRDYLRRIESELHARGT
jgi:5-oxoprolinase (ATP-hydrolysing) subunit C